MELTTVRKQWKTIAAFFAIYVLWGSTFLAIRIAVQQVPPWFSAGVRFFTAGVILFVFARLRGTPSPTGAQWRSLSILGLLMFSVTYGALFWGEQYVPSGPTSVLEATLPLITIILEVFVLRQQPFRPLSLVALTLGFLGVVVMVGGRGEHGLPIVPCLIILGGSVSWSLGSVLTRSLKLPSSRVLTAGAEMMLGGGLLLAASGIAGELRPFPALNKSAVFSLVYLITAGSLIGFTAFVWLLGRMPASRVASHAYVNPVVALALGYFVAKEEITTRTLVGATLVLVSVAVTLMTKASRDS